MRIIKNKTKAMAIAAFLMLTMSISILALPTTDAHDPILESSHLVLCVLFARYQLESAKMCLFLLE